MPCETSGAHGPLFQENKIVQQVQSELNARYDLLDCAVKRLTNFNIPNNVRFQLAATDVFIEKAQQRLTGRARWLFTFGGVLIFLTLGILGGGFYLIYMHTLSQEIQSPQILNGYTTTLLILKNTALAAFILGAAYVTLSFAKACLHEGTNLFSKRHALRFGRLYVYLRHDQIKFKELERAVNWNIENSTAFKEIKAETLTNTLAAKILGLPPEIIKAIMSSYRKTQKNTDTVQNPDSREQKA
jgi:hypothetical protein